MPRPPQAKLHIHGHVPSGPGSQMKHINVWIVYDNSTQAWEVRKVHDQADNEVPVQESEKPSLKTRM